MGMPVSVYKYDCTNGGVSAKAEDLFVVNVNGPFGNKGPSNVPTVKLVKRRYGNVVLVPEDDEDHVYMWGGNFGYSSDSRFCQAVEDLTGYPFSFPVAIHDRRE